MMNTSDELLVTLDTLDEAPGFTEPLSSGGVERKAAGLREATEAVRARGRRRAVARAAAAALVAVLVTGGSFVALQQPAPGLRAAPEPDLAGGDTTENTPSEMTRAVARVAPARPLVSYVRTDPQTLSRHAPGPTRAGVSVISDAELLASLNAAGLSAGLVRMEDSVTLAFNSPRREAR